MTERSYILTGGARNALDALLIPSSDVVEVDAARTRATPAHTDAQPAQREPSDRIVTQLLALAGSWETEAEISAHRTALVYRECATELRDTVHQLTDPSQKDHHE